MYRSLIKLKINFSEHIKTLLKPLIFIRHRLFLWCLVTPFALVIASNYNLAEAYNYSIKPDNLDASDYSSASKKINILSSFLIKTKSKDSFPVSELSGLAWDEDEQLLYAISDEGLLYHLNITIQNKQIKAVNIVTAMPLLNQQGKAIKGKFSDSEGLSLVNGNNAKKGDSQLIISFENKPRIAKYSTQGRFIKTIKTVKKLRKRKFFRARNKALESVTIHPMYGVLTAAERPLKENPLSRQAIYSSKGKKWNFPASKTKNRSVTALEVLSNNKVLILERAYNGLLSPVIISLRLLDLNKCDSSNLCETKTLTRLDSSEGWILDNFEGLSRIRDNQYLMVSDNNNNPLQKTILVLFEILN